MSYAIEMKKIVKKHRDLGPVALGLAMQADAIREGFRVLSFETERGLGPLSDLVEAVGHISGGLHKLSDATDEVAASIESVDAVEEVPRDKLEEIRFLVKKQINDVSLWFTNATAPEAYLQKALRELHEIIEGKTQQECAVDVLDEKKGYTVEDINKVERWFIALDEAKLNKAQEALDETIIELYGNLATHTNNAGPHEQIKYVFEQCGDKAFEVFGRTWDQWEWE